MNRIVLIVLGVVLVLGAISLSSALFIVREIDQVIVLQFGRPQRVIQDPGLHIKVPFIQNVQVYERRVLGSDPPGEEVILADQKRVVVDTYTRWRIHDPVLFYQAVNSEVQAQQRLSDIIISALRRVLGNYTLTQLLSEQRTEVMAQIREQVDDEAKALGIAVTDVRIRRADLPTQTSQAIYDRIRSERDREAREARAQGRELAQQIRARADRERTVIVAEAENRAQAIRGQGDADAIRIYADAFGQDPSFFSFYRSMEAYRNSLGDSGTTMVLSPDSDFFRYFGDISGGAGASAPAPAR
ncbi:protease modulator HflC [Roseospira marina]|uniref:Protein HflC n=1 Tax=Roseospira marina TaxID=140057 RepID=A0A5M6I9T6_9PROT|nr:protease modulator HflC [Roseospira marina]KAA5604495.1 protease modulator HflC [Roseospira marina]MBB4315547.1 membrane protease subunit HflC [Roseospira marina]MBB5088516.1 membrane protease subunit HflC [Roseospira marina]